MGVDPLKMGAFPNLSRNVPFCPRLSSFVLLGARNGDNRENRGQTGTTRDISGQIGQRAHVGSTPTSLSLMRGSGFAKFRGFGPFSCIF